jgi:hypothetical protein
LIGLVGREPIPLDQFFGHGFRIGRRESVQSLQLLEIEQAMLPKRIRERIRDHTNVLGVWMWTPAKK